MTTSGVLRSRATRLACVAAITVLALQIVQPPAALAVKRLVIVANQGVGTARLGMRDSQAKSKLGTAVVAGGRDNNYAGQTVYYFVYGKKRGRQYDMTMYSSRKHIVWMFSIVGGSAQTSKGISVGSTESSLKKAYGRAVGKRSTGVYTIYTLGRTRGLGTDFYVRNTTHKVTQIVVRNW